MNLYEIRNEYLELLSFSEEIEGASIKTNYSLVIK
jgi:hypothetical protein